MAQIEIPIYSQITSFARRTGAGAQQSSPSLFANLTGWHMIILLVVIILLFGAAKLLALAKSVGPDRILKGEIRKSRAEGQASTDVAETTQQHDSAPVAAPYAAGPRPTA